MHALVIDKKYPCQNILQKGALYLIVYYNRMLFANSLQVTKTIEQLKGEIEALNKGHSDHTPLALKSWKNGPDVSFRVDTVIQMTFHLITTNYIGIFYEGPRYKKGAHVEMFGCREARLPGNTSKIWQCVADSFKDPLKGEVVYLKGRPEPFPCQNLFEV